jgi:hypothetical protein
MKVFFTIVISQLKKNNVLHFSRLMKNFLLLFLCSFHFLATKKGLKTKFITDDITIDGKIDEAAWETVPVATDFIMFQPDNGKPIRMPKQ